MKLKERKQNVSEKYDRRNLPMRDQHIQALRNFIQMNITDELSGYDETTFIKADNLICELELVEGEIPQNLNDRCYRFACCDIFEIGEQFQDCVYIHNGCQYRLNDSLFVHTVNIKYK